LNYPIVRALERYHEFFGSDFTIEYFDGYTGASLGASHHTGWTALVADCIRRRHGSLPSVGELIARVTRGDDQTDAP
jgi:hypothetical protein